jgi:quinol monooxygenase YgiN
VYCIFIKTRLRPGCAEAFIDAIQVNAAASVSTEPGCLVFDVSRDRQDPDLVYLYEIYRPTRRTPAPRISATAGRWSSR